MNILRKRQTDEGSQKYRWLSPFVFSVERFGNDLRYPTLKNKLAARKKRNRTDRGGEAGAQDSSCKKEYIAFSKRKGCIPVQPEQIQDAVQTIREIIEEKKIGGKIGWKVCWCIWEMEIRSKKMPRFCREKECWSLSGLQVIGAVFGALLEEERAFLYGAGAQTLIEITENETSYWKADTRAKILTDLLKQNKGTLLF